MPAIRFNHASGSDGPGRVIEDRLAVASLGSAGLAIALADGPGGSGNGAHAADRVIAAFRAIVADPGSDRPLDEGATWTECLLDLDESMSRAEDFGESTAVVLVVTPNRIVGASVGDSEAHLWRPDPPASWLALTAQKLRNPLLKTGGALPVGFDVPHRRGTLLVSSDGLFNYAPAVAIQTLIAASGPLDRLPSALTDLARLRSSALPDDVSVVVARFAPD